MDFKNFVREFEENVVMVAEGTLEMSTVLENLEDWDSLAVVSTMAIADNMFGVQLDGEEIVSCTTFGELIDKVKNQLSGA
ncbi:hypothetical protein EJP82_21185 [Paenibacillus anaericanus]|uniref:Acyl carrier protein n=1 Tax=Paenibacillus anaericanus TaxID=170367 RepID=A0A433Y4K5_9BACL|nr:hypothetical protein [Paenibacillus anaericanus]RUT42995.1 hypothetical protein EJP82_21185 [Paenibacillus anaericanus]